MKVVGLGDRKKEKELESHNSIVQYLEEALEEIKNNEEGKAEAMILLVRTDDDQYTTSSYVPMKYCMELMGFLESIKITMNSMIMEDD